MEPHEPPIVWGARLDGGGPVPQNYDTNEVYWAARERTACGRKSGRESVQQDVLPGGIA